MTTQNICLQAASVMRPEGITPPILRDALNISKLHVLTCRWALVVLLMLLTTASAWADTAETYYIDADGIRHDVTATVLTGSDQASITELGSNDTETWYVVKNSKEGVDAAYVYKIKCKGNVNIILEDEAYFQLNGITVGDPNAEVREFKLSFGDDSNTTGIDVVDSGQWIGDSSSDSWYTLDGRKLNGEPTKKGMYIVNGKKVVIK